MTAEPLIERVSRAKARWLKRVMYTSRATAIEKCFAYIIADHLNCVTLDSWPGQPTVARLLGRASTRSAQRAGRGLARHGLITIKRNAGAFGYRYAPVFERSDDDRPVSKNGQLSTEDPAETVRESFLQTHLTSDPTEAVADKRSSERRYKRSQRGAVEVELIRLLGSDGLDILARLASIDDRIVDRLCRELFHGCLGPRELMAARLAAEQVRCGGVLPGRGNPAGDSNPAKPLARQSQNKVDEVDIRLTPVDAPVAHQFHGSFHSSRLARGSHPDGSPVTNDFQSLKSPKGEA